MIDKQIKTDVTYDVVEVEGNLYPVIQWCQTTFGEQGQRWFISNYRFYFLNSRDATLFELRWLG